MRKQIVASALAMLSGMALATQCRADAPGPGGGGINVVAGAKTGAQVYATVCQGCHMADAKGAVGAGRIPALAGNPAIGSTDYILTMVINGRGAMPPFRTILSDQQMVLVTSYIRTHFGNHYPETVTTDQVKTARQSND
ncbi:c-type cytochrome [Gluconacetobacter sp. Hr-1-5]|uniref:c-type cytochrome n=1 Tax=Gluconacetobacter sp. Hr-1-5 TaxID=3395370 RepID=UPI003B52C497